MKEWFNKQEKENKEKIPFTFTTQNRRTLGKKYEGERKQQQKKRSKKIFFVYNKGFVVELQSCSIQI